MNNSNPTLGRVTSVFTEDGTVWINLQHDRPSLSQQDIPFKSLSPGATVTPQEGDLVELYKMQSGEHAARFANNRPRFDMPDMAENEMVFRFDPDTEIRFYKNDDDRFVCRLAGDVTVEVEAVDDVALLAGNSISLGTDGDPLVTDVTTTTDSDGHVTDISLTKTTKTDAE